MSLASSIIKQMDKVLTKYHPQERLIYKRVTTLSSGDALIGQGVQHTSVTTLLTPQPIYQRLVRNIVGSDKYEQTLSSASGIEIDADYSMLVSTSALTTAELEQAGLDFVFKDTVTGAEETFSIADHEATAVQGQLIFNTIYIKSSTRPA